MPKPSVLHSGQECGHVEAACAVSAKVRDARAHAGHYGRPRPRNTISTSSRRYLLDTVCLDQGDTEVDNTQGAINDDDLINIMITVRMRLALNVVVDVAGTRWWRGRGRGRGQVAVRVHVQQSCSRVTSVGVRRQREKNSMDGDHTGVLPSAYVLRVLGQRSGGTPRRKHQGHAGEGG